MRWSDDRRECFNTRAGRLIRDAHHGSDLTQPRCQVPGLLRLEANRVGEWERGGLNPSFHKLGYRIIRIGCLQGQYEKYEMGGSRPRSRIMTLTPVVIRINFRAR
jgi:hypothetical protein